MRHALVVDDSSMMRSILRRALSFAGLDDEEIAEAKNGRVALEMIEASPPDLILCDVNMPELDGFGVLTALGEKGLLESIPCVMVTSRTSLATVRRLLELGAREVVAKPFEADRLHERIMAYLPEEKALDELSEPVDAALERALVRTLEQLVFCPADRVDGVAPQEPHIVAEIDVTGPAGTLLLAARPQAMAFVHPDGEEGVASATNSLEELLNVLVGAFRAELNEQSGSFGLPRTRLAAADDYALRGGLVFEVAPGEHLRVGFVRAAQELGDSGGHAPPGEGAAVAPIEEAV